MHLLTCMKKDTLHALIFKYFLWCSSILSLLLVFCFWSFIRININHQQALLFVVVLSLPVTVTTCVPQTIGPRLFWMLKETGVFTPLLSCCWESLSCSCLFSYHKGCVYLQSSVFFVLKELGLFVCFLLGGNVFTIERCVPWTTNIPCCIKKLKEFELRIFFFIAESFQLFTLFLILLLGSVCLEPSTFLVIKVERVWIIPSLFYLSGEKCVYLYKVRHGIISPKSCLCI